VRGIRSVLALVVASLIVGTGCTAAPPAGPVPDVVIVGFGDSIVYGSYYPKPWLYTLLDRLVVGTIAYTPEWPWAWGLPSTRHDHWYQADGIRVHNSGINGNTTEQMVSRFEEDVVAVRPDSCLILGGANDIFRGIPISTTKANLAQLYQKCADAGITPVACTLTPVKPGSLVGDSAQSDAPNASLDTLNAWIASYCAANEIAVIDFNAVVRANPSAYLQPDGIHPSQAGHDAMGHSVDLDVLGIPR